MERRVKGPATGLIVLAGLSIAWELFNLLGTALGFMAGIMEKVVEMMPPETPPEVRQALLGNAGNAGSLILTYVFGVIALGVYAFVLYGALQMLKLRSWVLAVAASIVAMVPCIGSCCCFVGLPLGIWSLVVLMNRDVKAAFASIASTAGTAAPPM